MGAEAQPMDGAATVAEAVAVDVAAPEGVAGGAAAEPPHTEVVEVVEVVEFEAAKAQNTEFTDLENNDAGASVRKLAAPGLCRRLLALRRRHRYKVAGALAMLAVGLAVMLWPRDAVWHLKELNMSPEVLNSFVGIVTGATTTSEPLSFDPIVQVYNPNFVGASVDPGKFSVFYKDAVMGGGTHGAINVGPRGTTDVPVHVTLTLTPSIGSALLQDATANNFQLTVDALVHANAHAGPLNLKAWIYCEVTADSLKILSTPNEVIGSKMCTYHFGL